MPVRTLFSASLLLVCLVARAQRPARRPVLVELFTSEGCSSCPPADALLARLDRDQPVAEAEAIVLSEHVDYWDQLGWRDRFSSHLLTERQSGYASRFGLPDVYTPQMVVAGGAAFNGADAGAAERALRQAAHAVSLPLTLTDARRDGRAVSATLALSGTDGPSRPAATLFAAVVSPSETTQVRSGENGGRTLRHVGVVLSLTRVGSTGGPTGSSTTIRAPLPASSGNLRLVVFAQAAAFGPVLGVATIAVPDASGPPVAGKESRTPGNHRASRM